ncbi:hypothetical protein SEUBUCD646_0F00740 [Saccharomyces eubayanus]|uniref:DCV1-like protein n=2 Tax=Saccharomyces TaxID=4930 RepID=A0ABN8VR05_SACEU|nr:hypothetical protein SEUBUCD650_0F00720 [Saccharomyces eubayanus]CAI2000832.1 hypothetical protein SEUBUCD646_0F00740 [Saccharomyces eubayanus]
MLGLKPTLLLCSLLQFISFIGFLLCCLTSPIIKKWGLAQHRGVSYGAFGYCRAAAVVSCSRIQLMYNPTKIPHLDSSLERWWSDPRARHIIGKLLICIPIATGLTFISFLFSLVFFFLYKPGGCLNVSLIISNSVLQTVTFLSTLFACVVILTQFHPYTTWCGWLTVPCSLWSLIVCVLSVLGFVGLHDQPETIDKEASVENVDSILKLYGRSQTPSTITDKSLQLTRTTTPSSFSHSMYVSANFINDDLQKTLDPYREEPATENQDQPQLKDDSPLKQDPLVNFFIPKLNDTEMFSRRDAGKQETFPLNKIDLASIPVKQEEGEVPIEKKMENILYYEGISSHSQRNYDPPWLFGAQVASAARLFKIYSQRDYQVTAPPQYQLHHPLDFQHQEDVYHNFTSPSYPQQVGDYHNYNYNSHSIPNTSKHTLQTLSDTYVSHQMVPKKYKPAYRQRMRPVKSSPQPAYSFY